jgi:ferredoxin-fold anticodon binding domain-containing protein
VFNKCVDQWAKIHLPQVFILVSSELSQWKRFFLNQEKQRQNVSAIITVDQAGGADKQKRAKLIKFFKLRKCVQ